MESSLQSYAVELYFGSSAEAAILELRRALFAAGVPESPRQVDARPHLSLSVLETADEASLLAAVEAVVTDWSPLPLSFGAVGGFAGEGHVLFLAPAASEGLLRRQRELSARLQVLPGGTEVWPHYLPGRWTPHCTLVMEVGAGQLATAFAAVHAALRPLETDGVAVGVVAFPPQRRLATFPLE